MKYVSLFAGIGGFDLALNRGGHTCVYVNEWNQYAAKIYEKNFNHKPDTKDIRTVDVSDIPAHDLLVGGFPCQSFSIAGKRQGFNEARGTLFFEICRIATAKRTPYLLLENVKGLLSHDSGKTFTTIIRSLDGMGYDCQWQVLNSKNFGVPQNRERIYIVGHLRGIPQPKVFPFREGIANTTEKIRFGKYQQDYLNLETGIAPTVTAYESHGKGYSHNNLVALTERRTDEARAIRREMMKNGQDWSPRRGKILVPREDGKANTITAGKTKEHLLSDGIRVRRLTPVECERLQGFPDGWTEGISDTQRYKCLGNAVTVNVIYEIIKRFSDKIC
jgi:DNA (cytosine-5)-methyltransferase 1